MNPGDLYLIQRCLAKDPAAWDEFVNRYSSLIYDAVVRTFEHYGHPRRKEELADIHNDVFVLIIDDECRVLKQFEGRNGCQLGHYLRTVAIRRTVDYLRRIRPMVSLDQDNEGTRPVLQVASPAESAPSILISQEQQTLLEQFFHELNDSEREFFRLIINEGLTSESIAHRLGISVDYVYVRKKRLMDKLRLMAVNKERIKGEV